jgi:hypothetical protein
MNEFLEWWKTFILTVLGHAFTGAATAFIYELGRLVQSGITDWSVLVTGALIGASLAFFKVIVEEIQKIVIEPQPVPATNAKVTFKGKIPPPPALPKKTLRTYLGI